MPKITAFTELTTPPAAGDLIPVVDVSDATQSAGGTTKYLQASTIGLTYKRYVALLTQSGTDAPVATVLENTLGGTVVWGYSSTGVYTATLAGAFTSAKTLCFPNGGSGSQTVRWTRTSDDVLTITVNTDTAISAGSIEIRVYP